jgi:hypothetical protein
MSRTLEPSIWRDDFFISLATLERLIWIGLITTVADDQGRMLNNPLLVRADLFPLDNIESGEISAALDKFVQAGKLHAYRAEGKELLQIVNWWKYQKASAWMGLSKYPAPEHWIDRARFHGKGNQVVDQNWNHPGGFNGHLPSQQPSTLPSPIPSALPSREGEGKGEGKGEGEGKRERKPVAPELQIWRQATGRFPSNPQNEFVITAIQENGLTADQLKQAYEAWTCSGYNPTNVKGIIDFALDPSRQGKNGKTSSRVATRIFDENAENLKTVLGGDA